MKNSIYMICIWFILASCTGPGNRNDKAPVGEAEVVITKKQVVEATRDYLKNSLKNPIVSENGDICRIQGVGETYVFDLSGVTIGMLDEDNRQDAVISCIYEKVGEPLTTKHFILLKGDSLSIITSVISAMKVLKIADNTVYGEISTRPEDDPGIAPCNVCTDTIRYRMQGDSLIKLE